MIYLEKNPVLIQEIGAYPKFSLLKKKQNIIEMKKELPYFFMVNIYRFKNYTIFGTDKTITLVVILGVPKQSLGVIDSLWFFQIRAQTTKYPDTHKFCANTPIN